MSNLSPALDGWQTCPRCQGDLAAHPGPEPSDPWHLRCENCKARFYGSADIAANALLRDAAGRVLMVRRAGEPRKGTWDLPGGFVAHDESAELAVVREVEEETQLVVDPQSLDFVGTFTDSYNGMPTLNIFFAMDLAADQPADGVRAFSDIEEPTWMGKTQIGQLIVSGEIGYQCVADALSRYFRF